LPFFGVQNLFCGFLEYKIYFAVFWSAKFILPFFGVENLFCRFLECKIYFAVFWKYAFAKMPQNIELF
jgi:predicted secreted protein